MIIGRLVALRAVEKEDIHSFVEWLNDPEINFYLSTTFPISKTEWERWYERVIIDVNLSLIHI